MAEWVALLPLVLLAAGVLFLPGLLIGWGLRLRGIVLCGFAPAAGTAAVALSAIFLDVAGIPWGLASAALSTAALAVLALGVGWFLRGDDPETRKSLGWGAGVAVIVGMLLSTARMAVMIGQPSYLSQTNDAVFHFNVLRFVEDSGSASSLSVTGVVDSSAFYPAAWHALTALVVEAAGGDFIRSSNAMSLVIAGAVWTTGIAALVWAATRGGRVATVASAIFGATLFVFPFLMLDFGVLYPYALSLAILPGIMAATIDALGGRPSAARVVRVLLITLVGLAALALAQPAIILVWVAFALTYGGWALVGAARAGRPVIAVVGILLLAVASVAVWHWLTTSTGGDHWVPLRSTPDALFDLIANAPAGNPPMIATSVFALVGLVVAAATRGLRWLPTLWIVFAGLAFVATAVNNPQLRTVLLGAWYGDPFRLLALMPLVVVPAAAIGFAWLTGLIARRSALAASIVGTLVLGLTVAEAAVWTWIDRTYAEDTYTVDAESFVSADELALMTELDQYVGPDDRVLVNPSAGGAFGYALSGRDVVPRTWSMPMDDDFQRLRWHLREAAYMDDVCGSLDRMGVDYVLDFGAGSAEAGRWVMPGMTGFTDADGFELVAERGDASLWRITACSS